MGERGGEERHHMTTTVPCRGVYKYNIHNYTMYMYMFNIHGCELIPERRGRREREGLG